MKQLLFLLSGACLITACSVSKNTITMEKSAITGIKWKLTELNGKTIADKVNGKEPFLEFLETDSRYTALAGCNTINGKFTLLKNKKIKFSQGMSTMMACENMEVETGLNKVLIATDNYTINGDTLSLSKGRMAPLARFQAVKTPVTNNELGGTWEVDYISGIRIAFDGLYPDKKPVITFNLADNKATGNSSCNNFNTTFAINGDNIKFNDPMSTKMACQGGGEAAFFKTLKAVTNYSVNGNTLNLMMGDIAIMRLQKK